MANELEKQVGDKTGTSLMTTPIARQIIIPQSWIDGDADGEFQTTLDMDKPASRGLLINSINGACEPMEKHLNIELQVIGWTITPAAITDQKTGEVTSTIRTILHCVNGLNVHAFSRGVLKSLRTIAQFVGRDGLTKPLIIKPVRINTSGGRSMYRLDLIG